MSHSKWICFIAVAACSTATFADTPVVRVIEGVVSDSKGRPLKGADVEWGVFDHGRRWREVFRTDEDGRYRVETTNVGVDYRLGVSCDGFAPQWRDGVIPKRIDQTPTKVDFRLALPITVRGRVLDRAGHPIAGIEVVAKMLQEPFIRYSYVRPTFPFPGPEHTGITDTDGNFAIGNLPPTEKSLNQETKKGYRYELSLRGPGGTNFGGVGFSEELNVLKASRTATEALASKGEIYGKVVDATTRQPIKDFTLAIRHQPTQRSFSHETGLFRIENLQSNWERQILIYADGYAPGIQSILPKNMSGLPPRLFRLTPAASFKGRVTDADGHPIENAAILFGLKEESKRVNWRHFDEYIDGNIGGLATVQRCVTASDGQFSFSQFPAETDDAEIQRKYLSNRQPILMINAPGFVKKIVSLHETARRVRQGQLAIKLEAESAIVVETLCNGKFHPYTGVRLDNYYGGKDETEFDGNSKHRIGGLDGGDYLLRFTIWIGSSYVALERQVSVPKHKTVSLKIDYESGNCRLSGKAPPFSSISLTPSEVDRSTNEVVLFNATTADADGAYSIDGLHSGSYDLACSPPHIRHRPSNGTGVESHKVKGIEISDSTAYDIELPKPRSGLILPASASPRD